MTQEQIDVQIEAIRRVTREACKNKESALQFLSDAGIIKKMRYENGQPCHGDKCWAHLRKPCEVCGRTACEGVAVVSTL